DHRPFPNPHLPDFETVLPEAQPLHTSQSVPPADFPPIEYGLEEAVARWAGSIWATETPPVPEHAAGEEAAAPADAARAQGAQQTLEGPPGERTQAAPTVAMESVRLALARGASPLVVRDSALAGLLSGTDGWFDESLFAIALPGIRNVPAKGKRA